MVFREVLRGVRLGIKNGYRSALLDWRRRKDPHGTAAKTQKQIQFMRYLDDLISSECKTIVRQSRGKKRPLFVDCGSNEGTVLEKFMSKLLDFHFIGFEVQQELVAICAGRNPRAVIRHEAVGVCDGEIDIFLPRGFGWNYRGATTTIEGKLNDDQILERRTVPQIDFVSFLCGMRDQKGCDYIVVKMDIEGAEYAILERLLSEEATHLIDHLIIEYHDDVAPAGKTGNAYSSALEAAAVSVTRWV